jgi:hypothetical protein
MPTNIHPNKTIVKTDKESFMAVISRRYRKGMARERA